MPTAQPVSIFQAQILNPETDYMFPNANGIAVPGAQYNMQIQVDVTGADQSLTFEQQIWASFDNGLNWIRLASSTHSAAPYINPKTGQPSNVRNLGVVLNQGQYPTHARMVVRNLSVSSTLSGGFVTEAQAVQIGL